MVKREPAEEPLRSMMKREYARQMGQSLADASVDLANDDAVVFHLLGKRYPSAAVAELMDAAREYAARISDGIFIEDDDGEDDISKPWDRPHRASDTIRRADAEGQPVRHCH